MVFLNPTILFGLLAASIPVLLHFLNLRKIKKVEFSTLAFLKELQKSKIKKIKIKQLLLLLLRILIIVFLVLSFSRPTSQSNSIGIFDSKAKTTAVFIIDNSFSMSLVDEKGSFLNQAKNIASKISTMYNSNDEVYIITTGRAGAKLFLKPKILDDIEISHITTPMSKSIKSAIEILNSSVNLNKELFVFSDFQRAALFGENDTTSFTINDVRIFAFPFGKRNVSNLSVTNVEIRNQIFEYNKQINISSETSNYTTNSVNNKLNSIYFNDKRVAQKNISINSQASNSALFKTTIDSKGLIEIKSSIEDDELLFDNEYFNFIIVPDKIKILLIGNAESDFVFVKSVLESSYKTSIDYVFENSEKAKNINFGNYNTAMVVENGNSVLNDKIKKYVSAGGSIILFPNSKIDYTKQNKLLSKLDLPQFSGKFKDANNSVKNSFDVIDLNHPIFYGLFSGKNKEIDSPKIYKYLKLNTNGIGRSIISLHDNSSFLSEFKVYNGKVLLFNVHPSLDWSDFPIKNIFAPLLNRSISYLVSNSSSNDSLITGEVVSFDVSKRKTNQIKIIRPDKTKEIVNIHDSKSNFVNYTKSNLPGIYKVYSDNSLIDVKAVNHNVLESDLEALSQEERIDKFKNDSNEYIEVSPTDDYKTKILAMRFGSEFWQIFLIIAILLAVVEMLVARSSKKDIAEL